MMFPPDSWGRINNPNWYYSEVSIPIVKPNRKKNRKASRQMRKIKGKM